jgi:hypothetical protein
MLVSRMRERSSVEVMTPPITATPSGERKSAPSGAANRVPSAHMARRFWIVEAVSSSKRER